MTFWTVFAVVSCLNSRELTIGISEAKVSCFTFLALGATSDRGVIPRSAWYTAIGSHVGTIILDFLTSRTELSDFSVSDADNPPRALGRFFCSSGTFVVDRTWLLLVGCVSVAIVTSFYCDIPGRSFFTGSTIKAIFRSARSWWTIFAKRAS